MRCDDVSQYDVGAGGALTPKSPARVAAGAFQQQVAISPDGKSVYVTNGIPDNLSQYDLGPGGELSSKSPATVPAGAFPMGGGGEPGTARPDQQGPVQERRLRPVRLQEPGPVRGVR
jgi:DNA-binding beta-propeller fold protein YncE